MTGASLVNSEVLYKNTDHLIISILRLYLLNGFC